MFVHITATHTVRSAITLTRVRKCVSMRSTSINCMALCTQQNWKKRTDPGMFHVIRPTFRDETPSAQDHMRNTASYPSSAELNIRFSTNMVDASVDQFGVGSTQRTTVMREDAFANRMASSYIKPFNGSATIGASPPEQPEVRATSFKGDGSLRRLSAG